jgi:hypothetical protein
VGGLSCAQAGAVGRPTIRVTCVPNRRRPRPEGSRGVLVTPDRQFPGQAGLREGSTLTVLGAGSGIRDSE